MIWGGGGGFSPKIHPKMKKSQIKIASAHIPIQRNNPAKFHNNPMDSLGEVADNIFRTDGWTYVRTGRKDKGNLVFPTSLKAGHKKQTIHHSWRGHYCSNLIVMQIDQFIKGKENLIHKFGFLEI